MRILLLFLFAVSHAIYFAYNLWVTKHAPSLQLLGTTFKSYWTYSLFALLLATPVLSVANYVFAMAFYWGHRELGAIWIVLSLFLLAQLVSMLLVPFVLLGELPSMRALAGVVLALIGLFLTMSGET